MITIKDQDGGLVAEGEETAEVASARVWAPGPTGEELYEFRDVSAHVGADASNGGAVLVVSWTDDTDRNPRKSAPANVRHTVEIPMPGGGVGPFVVSATEHARASKGSAS